MGFPTKNDHFGVFWGYHHLRKHPSISSEKYEDVAKYDADLVDSWFEILSPSGSDFCLTHARLHDNLSNRRLYQIWLTLTPSNTKESKQKPCTTWYTYTFPQTQRHLYPLHFLQSPPSFFSSPKAHPSKPASQGSGCHELWSSHPAADQGPPWPVSRWALETPSWAILLAKGLQSKLQIPPTQNLHTLIFHHFSKYSVHVHLNTWYLQRCTCIQHMHNLKLWHESHPSIDTNHKNDSQIISKPHVPVLNSDLPAESPKIWKVAPKR